MYRIAGYGEHFLELRHCKERECSCVVDAEAEDPTNPWLITKNNLIRSRYRREQHECTAVEPLKLVNSFVVCR